MKKSRILSFATIVGIFVYANISFAAMSSTNYQIKWDTFSTGGSDTSSSASYILRDTVANSGAGNSTSSSYQVDAGYRGGIFDEIITFDLYLQDETSSRAITALSSTTVSMSSTTGLSAGQYVAVVEDQGASQVTAIGKISSVAAGSIVLDSLSTNGTTPTIDGTNDYLYELDASALGFGTFSTSTVSTAIAAFEVTVENDNGYIIQVLEDDDLSTGAADITDVADGTVTAGSTEYGAISSDTTLADTTFDTADTAITTTGQDIVTVSSTAFDDRSFLTLKAAIADGATVGTYSHALTFIVSGTF